MKRSFLVLILMFMASPAASAEQSSCPCFNDLQIAGTCSRAHAVFPYLSGPGALLLCYTYTGSDPGTEWTYGAVADSPPTCVLSIYLDVNGQGGDRKDINLKTTTITPEQLDDCVGQIISAAEMLN